MRLYLCTQNSNNMKQFFTIVIAAMMLHGAVSAQSTTTRELTNLVIFIRFADDEEITHPFADIDTMFNGRTPGYYSVYNFYDALSYGRIHYNTVYTNNIQNGTIVSYRDTMPRGYFQSYSETNPIGYHGQNPLVGISMREAQLQARAFRYVDSLELVSPDVVLDGDGDGDIDNVSFIVKGGIGEWASILWPHMEYFPHDSIDHPVTVNGVRPNTFNFEFEGAPDNYFSSSVFCHEMGHSLDLPDLYHYEHYTSVSPAGSWDMMCNNHGRPKHTAAIYKNKVLHVSDDPIEITRDGDYTLRSVGSSPSQNCYYIKSSIDSTQWFLLEYRYNEDLFEDGIPGSGLIVARWSDTVPLDYSGMFANAFFDGQGKAHQYWIFRPWSDIDTEDGNLYQAHFSAESGRTEFGPSTDPHPYLTDGTPETSFEITDIQENGTELTFHVHFFNAVDINEASTDNIKVYAEHDRIVVSGADGEQVSVFDMKGCLVRNQALPAGVYIVKVGNLTTQKIVIVK